MIQLFWVLTLHNFSHESDTWRIELTIKHFYTCDIRADPIALSIVTVIKLTCEKARSILRSYLTGVEILTVHSLYVLFLHHSLVILFSFNLLVELHSKVPINLFLRYLATEQLHCHIGIIRLYLILICVIIIWHNISHSHHHECRIVEQHIDHINHVDSQDEAEKDCAAAAAERLELSAVVHCEADGAAE